MKENELGAVGGYQGTSIRNLNLSIQHEIEMQDMRKSTFGILMDLRNNHNEDRARQIMRDTPTEIRKRARSRNRKGVRKEKEE